MTKKQLKALAAKLFDAFQSKSRVVGWYPGMKFGKLPAQDREAWMQIAKVAGQELTNNPRPIRRRAPKPKACRLTAHGAALRWECGK